MFEHSRKIKRAAQRGRPYAHATPRYDSTSHSAMIAAPGRLRVVLGAGHSLLIGGSRRSRPTPFAPPAASVARQCERHQAGGEEYAKRQHHPKPVGIHRYIPSARSHRPIPTRSERSNHSQARGIGRPITGIKRQTCARQPGVTLVNVWNREKFRLGRRKRRY